MYKAFLICLLVSHASASNEPVFREDYKYYKPVNAWMKLHTVPAAWFDARLRCLAEGASLASPTDLIIGNVMITMMIVDSVDPSIGVYTGIHSTFFNGTYTTLEGVPISRIPYRWATGQPDHVYTENCVIFHIKDTLEDVPCTDVFEFICYKKFEELAINQCNTVDNGYKLDKRTGHCYKFHTQGQTWSQAYMTCTAEGGYLAVINSHTEAEILKELWAKYPNEKIFSSQGNVAGIGFREWPSERSWYTIHGQTLEEAGYNNWYEGQPDLNVYESEVQHCGGIHRNGSLSEFWCDKKIAFICEKEPETSQ